MSIPPTRTWASLNYRELGDDLLKEGFIVLDLPSDVQDLSLLLQSQYKSFLKAQPHKLEKICGNLRCCPKGLASGNHPHNIPEKCVPNQHMGYSSEDARSKLEHRLDLSGNLYPTTENPELDCNAVKYVQHMQQICTVLLSHLCKYIEENNPIPPSRVAGHSPVPGSLFEEVQLSLLPNKRDLHLPHLLDYSLFRINSYNPDCGFDLQCPCHFDSGYLTVIPVCPDPGLEIKDMNTFEWIAVEKFVKKNLFIVLVGETLSFLSGRLFTPTPHQVCNNDADRLSLCYLNRPDFTIDLQPCWPRNSSSSPVIKLNEQLNITNRVFRTDQIYPLVQVSEQISKIYSKNPKINSISLFSSLKLCSKNQKPVVQLMLLWAEIPDLQTRRQIFEEGGGVFFARKGDIERWNFQNEKIELFHFNTTEVEDWARQRDSKHVAEDVLAKLQDCWPLFNSHWVHYLAHLMSE